MKPQAVFVNAITFMRVPFIVAWFAMAVADEFSPSLPLALAAGACMFLSGLTDAFDGALARRWKVVSPLGKMADPLMDKVFYVVALPTLSWILSHQGDQTHSLVMLVVAVLCILRDLWVTFLRSVGSLFGADGAAMWLGKVRTAFTFPGAGAIYAFAIFNDCESLASARPALLAACYVVEAAMLAINFASVCTYTRAYMPYLRKALEKGS